MFEVAVGNRDPDRGSLVSIPIGTLQLARVSGDQARAQQRIDDQVDLLLDRMLRVVIDKNDFGLFRDIVRDLSLSVIIEDPTRSSSDLDSLVSKSLYTYRLDLSQIQNRRKIERLRFALRVSSMIQFDNILRLPEQFIDIWPKLRDDSTEILKDVRDHSLSYYLMSALLRRFFLVSVSILFSHSQKVTDATEYLSALWHYTRPEDADGFVLNATPVPTDSLWLTLLYLYGGAHNDLWHERYYFLDFHGTRRYLTQAYLIALAKIAKPISSPSHSDLKELADCQLWPELEQWYEVANLFLQETESPAFRSQLEALPSLGVESFIQRSIPTKQGQTWNKQLELTIEDARTKFSEAKKIVEIYLPLDEEKTRTCISKIKAAYHASRIADRVAVPVSCQTNADLARLTTFSNRFPQIPKHCFVKPANWYCETIWGQIGEDIALQETLHVLQIASKVQYIVIDKYDPDKVLQAVEREVSEMSDKEGGPQLAFVPLALVSDWIREFRISHTPRMSLPIADTRLELIHSSKPLPFHDVVIIDRRRCQWLCRDLDEPLRVTIRPTVGSDSVKVNADAHGSFMPQQDGIRVIRIPDLTGNGTSHDKSPT
jgi:hypothetical protein